MEAYQLYAGSFDVRSVAILDGIAFSRLLIRQLLMHEART